MVYLICARCGVYNTERAIPSTKHQPLIITREPIKHSNRPSNVNGSSHLYAFFFNRAGVSGGGGGGTSSAGKRRTSPNEGTYCRYMTVQVYIHDGGTTHASIHDQGTCIHTRSMYMLTYTIKVHASI